RAYDSPITDACSPFWNFISPEDAPVHGGDIVSPTVASRPLDLLNFYDIRYVALYSKYAGPDSDPVVSSLETPLQGVVASVSHAPPLYADDYVSIHKVDATSIATAPASFYIGHGWYTIEHSSNVPFRWI